jgi:transmembrane sensor
VIERAREEMAARTASWDDLRERRVLGRIEAALDDRRRSRRGPVAAIATAAVLAAAAVLLWMAWRPAPTELASALAGLEVRRPAAVAGVLAMPDGSQATLHDGALVQMRVASDAAIRLEQTGGRVHYEVVPGLPRAFTVVAGEVEVHVVGTAFTVAQDGAHVRVAVEHGRVRVSRTDGSLIAELGAGEEVRVDGGMLARGIAPADDEIEFVDDGDAPPKAARGRKPDARPAKPSTEIADAQIESAAVLEARADDARRRGDKEAAAVALRALVEHHPKDSRVYSALFTLAKVERGRGRHAVAAGLFAKVVARDPSGSLAEDARAEAASSWFSAGRHDEARAAAEDYLARHPAGAHASRMQRLLERVP